MPKIWSCSLPTWYVITLCMVYESKCLRILTSLRIGWVWVKSFTLQPRTCGEIAVGAIRMGFRVGLGAVLMRRMVHSAAGNGTMKQTCHLLIFPASCWKDWRRKSFFSKSGCGIMVEHLADNGAVRKTSYVFVCLSISLSSHLLLLSPLQFEQPSSTAQTAFTRRKPVRFLWKVLHREFYRTSAVQALAWFCCFRRNNRTGGTTSSSQSHVSLKEDIKITSI